MDETNPSFLCDIDDSIRIGDDITLTVTGVKPSHVKFGIRAPRDMAIDRLESQEQESPDQ